MESLAAGTKSSAVLLGFS